MAKLACATERAEGSYEPVAMLLSFSLNLLFVSMELAGGVKHLQTKRVNCNEFDFALLFTDASQAVPTGICKLPAAGFVCI